MTTAVATPETFQERMFARVRESMGDLMTDDELKKIVDAAMQRAFFEPREVRDGYHTRTEQPYFVALIQKEMQSEVQKQISAWIANHPEEIKKVLDEVIAKGIFGMMVQHFEQKTSWPLQQMVQQLTSKGVL